MLPLELQSRYASRVGQEGVEPPPPGYQPGVLPLNYRPSVSPLSRRVEPSSLAIRQPAELGAGGIRTPADRLKRPTCCRYTTTPGGTPRAGVCVWSRSSPRSSLRVSVRESGRPDSNRRSQAPRACGLARLSHALIVPASSPCGNRTHLSALKGRYPRPIDERANVRGVGRGALESPSAGLQPAARPSQLPTRSCGPNEKGPVSFVTPGLRLRARDVRGRASRPQGIERERARR